VLDQRIDLERDAEPVGERRVGRAPVGLLQRQLNLLRTLGEGGIDALGLRNRVDQQGDGHLVSDGVLLPRVGVREHQSRVADREVCVHHAILRLFGHPRDGILCEPDDALNLAAEHLRVELNGLLGVAVEHDVRVDAHSHGILSFAAPIGAVFGDEGPAGR